MSLYMYIIILKIIYNQILKLFPRYIIFKLLVLKRKIKTDQKFFHFFDLRFKN